MAKPSHNLAFPHIKRIRQRSDYHCGPAVLVMLASHLGIEMQQHDIVRAAGAVDTYRRRGMNVWELGLGITTLQPELSFWYKAYASIDDIDLLVNKLHIPVGVEWQGAFGKYADEDNGHYSVVTELRKETNTITLSDPFYYFAGTDRMFPIDEFQKRWWDENEVTTDQGVVEKKDEQMLFVLTKQGYTFPEEFGLHMYTK